jgi:hypothetical protein
VGREAVRTRRVTIVTGASSALRPESEPPPGKEIKGFLSIPVGKVVGDELAGGWAGGRVKGDCTCLCLRCVVLPWAGV